MDAKRQLKRYLEIKEYLYFEVYHSQHNMYRVDVVSGMIDRLVSSKWFNFISLEELNSGNTRVDDLYGM